MANRTHLLELDPRRLTKFIRCGWFKGHQLDERDERVGRRVSRHHHTRSGDQLNLLTTEDPDEADCKRCRKAIANNEHPYLDNPHYVYRPEPPERTFRRQHQEIRVIDLAPDRSLWTVPTDEPPVYEPMAIHTVSIDWAADANTDVVWDAHPPSSRLNYAVDGFYQVNASISGQVVYTTITDATIDTNINAGVLMATGDVRWDRWVLDSNTTATTPTTAIDPTWATWTTAGAGTTLTYDDLWRTWVDMREAPAPRAVAAIDNAGRRINRRGAGRQYTQREHDEYLEQARRDTEERLAQRVEAERVAEELLLAHLPPELAEQWAANQQLIIEGQSGVRYGIRKGRVHNIIELDDDGKEVNTLCCLPKSVDGDHLPDGDVILGQILHLKHNEEEFRKVANISRPYGVELWTPRVVAAGRQDEEEVA